MSVAYWPEGTIKFQNDKTTDRHRSRRAAEAVCRGLKERGFGGRGKIFPIRTEVVPCQEK